MTTRTADSATPTALVFVHGFGCSHVDWHAQLRYLAPNHAVLAVDLRGHGDNPASADECSIENYAADVAGTLTRSDLGAAVLVGHSMGCRVVLEAARRSWEKLRGVVLIDSSQLAASDPAEAEREARNRIDAVGFAAFSKAFFEGMFVSTSPETIKRDILRRAASFPAVVGQALFPRMVAWDAQHMDAALRALEGRRVPLLVIQSSYLNPDRTRVSIAPGGDTPWLQNVRRCVPSARIEIVPGVGHFPQLEAPQHVNRLIASFVADPFGCG